MPAKTLKEIDRRADLIREYEDEDQESYDEYDEWESQDNPNDRMSQIERMPCH